MTALFTVKEGGLGEERTALLLRPSHAHSRIQREPVRDAESAADTELAIGEERRSRRGEENKLERRGNKRAYGWDLSSTARDWIYTK